MAGRVERDRAGIRDVRVGDLPDIRAGRTELVDDVVRCVRDVYIAGRVDCGTRRFDRAVRRFAAGDAVALARRRCRGSRNLTDVMARFVKPVDNIVLWVGDIYVAFTSSTRTVDGDPSELTSGERDHKQRMRRRFRTGDLAARVF